MSVTRALSLTLAGVAVVAACSDDDGTTAGTTSGSGGASSATTAPTTTADTGPASTSTGLLPPSFPVSGVVVDQDGLPVADAIVMQGGGERSTTTAADGTFSWELTDQVDGERVLVAAKIGYRSAGEAFAAVPDGSVMLILYEVSPPDNTGYSFGHPGVGDHHVDVSTAFCGHCHTTFAAEFNQSAHARATRDPRVQDLYAGVASALDSAGACAAAGGVWRTGRVPGQPSSTAPRCYVGDGVLPDLNGCGGPAGLACDDPALPLAQQPESFGACADCHAIGMDGPLGGRDLLEAEGIAFELGNHCDACHHIREVGGLDEPPGVGGRVVMQRPREKIGDEIQGMTRQAMFGPYPDVPLPFMGGSYQPQFATAELCSGCHDQRQAALVPQTSLDPARWPEGLPTHSTFTEWQEGPFTATPCQGCHMPPKQDLFNAVDVTTPETAGISGGFVRPADRIRSHAFRGPLAVVDGLPRLLDTAATIDLVASEAGGSLEVTATVENEACGHALPSGEPMRAAFLVVRAEACGESLAAVNGPTIDDVGADYAVGQVGVDVTVGGATVTWPAGAAVAAPGKVVRVVRPTGTFLDYEGVGFFASPSLTPAQKGLELRAPVAEAIITSVNGADIVLDGAIGAQAGDRVVIADPVPQVFVDGDTSRALSGASGLAFARVLADATGRRMVPHHRAIDMLRDNRLLPLTPHTAAFTFALPPGCTEATVRATLVYRPHPLALSLERGWDARDYVATESSTVVPLP